LEESFPSIASKTYSQVSESKKSVSFCRKIVKTGNLVWPRYESQQRIGGLGIVSSPQVQLNCNFGSDLLSLTFGYPQVLMFFGVLLHAWVVQSKRLGRLYAGEAQSIARAPSKEYIAIAAR
jgi:hypothetical protein